MTRLLLVAMALLVAGGAGGAGYVRFAPSDPARWHVAPAEAEGPPGEVLTVTGGATLHLTSADPAMELAALDAIALTTPRTTRLAGSATEVRITWITRSRLWGFPDYTTAEITPDGLTLYARQRFGSNDWGVNAARLKDWQAQLSLASRAKAAASSTDA